MHSMNPSQLVCVLQNADGNLIVRRILSTFDKAVARFKLLKYVYISIILKAKLTKDIL